MDPNVDKADLLLCSGELEIGQGINSEVQTHGLPSPRWFVCGQVARLVKGDLSVSLQARKGDGNNNNNNNNKTTMRGVKGSL